MPVAASRQIVGTSHGAVSGRVTDPSGNPLPEAVVTLSGASLMVPRVTASAGNGNYVAPALAPGSYTVTFEHSGFRPASIDVTVGSGFTATVDAVLQLAALAESVTVEARAAVIDRHTSVISQTLTREQLAAVPGSRSMFAVLSSTPGIQVSRFEVGGSAGDVGGLFGAYGTEGSSRPTVEGINVTQISSLGFTLDYGAFEEASVGLGAYGPEWPVPGVHLQFLGKSGGNEYRGTLYADFEHRRWQSHNIDADQQRRASAGGSLLSLDANRVWRDYDVNGDVGGYVVRDRAWWYASIRDQDVQLRQVNFPVEPSRTQLRNYTGKATVRSGRHTFIGFAQTGRNEQPNRLDPFGPAGGQAINASTGIHRAVDATSHLRVSGIVWKAEWNATFGQRLFAEARAGQFDVRRSLTPNGSAARIEDIDTLVVTGGGRRSERRMRRDQFQASASYFRDGWEGSHQFKAGGERPRDGHRGPAAGGLPRECAAGDSRRRGRGGVPVPGTVRVTGRVARGGGARWRRLASERPAHPQPGDPLRPLPRVLADTGAAPGRRGPAPGVSAD